MTIPLFSKLSLRGLTLRNRIAISAMCMYSAKDGVADDFHLAHYGRFALGGAGLVMVEATGITANSRITHGDLGLWSDGQIAPLARIVNLVQSQGSAIGIQLAHTGRKACRQRPWYGNGPIGADDFARGDMLWPITSASAIAFGDAYQTPEALTLEGIAEARADFISAAKRALAAGFDVLEIHAAHGFLLHSFMCPATNIRTDGYNGDFDARHRLAFEVAEDMRAIWPDDKPLFFRISVEDGVDNGRPFEETLRLAAGLRARGVDVVDCSSGGIGGHSASTSTNGPSGFGFQIPFAARIKQGSDVATMAVGLITEPDLANRAIAEDQCDLVAIGRAALFDPNWPHHAAKALMDDPNAPVYGDWPKQYGWWLERREPMLRKLIQQDQ